MKTRLPWLILKFCRYGAEASETVHHSLRALGHGTLAGIQVYELGPRSIAGKMTRRYLFHFSNYYLLFQTELFNSFETIH